MNRTTNDEVVTSWSRLTGWRKEYYQRFSSILEVPIRSLDQELNYLLRPDSRVLDVGAGVHQPLRRSLTTQRYFSLDNDPEGTFDFRTFSDVPANMQFDVMVANQVFEHLTIPDAFAMLRAAYRHLVDGGCFLATVPNVAHPVRYWGDATHVTAWPVDDLYGLFREVGFEVPRVARYTKRFLPRNPLKRWVIGVISETFRIDWCDSLMMVGQKKP